MNLWIVLAIVIESMACLGTLGVLVKRNTRPAFLAGFNTMLLVTGTYVLYSRWLDSRTIAVLVMVAVYLVRMNWLLLAWQKYTAVPKLNRRLSASEKYFFGRKVPGTISTFDQYLAFARFDRLNHNFIIVTTLNHIRKQ
jgi:hypothetical protein